jgi:hypothetical protein
VAWGSIVLTTLGAYFGATEWLIRTQVEPYDNFIKHLEFFRTAKARNIAIGDSLVALGFTGQAEFANLAYPSETIPIAAEKIRLYFANRKIGLVIVQADAHQFCKHRVERSPESRTRVYKDLRRLRMLSPVHRTQWVLYWKTFLAKGYFKSKYTFQADGAQTLTKSIRGKPDDTSSICNPVENFAKTRVAEAYQFIATFVKMRGGSLCLVSFPETPTRKSTTQANKHHSRVNRWFKTFAKEQRLRLVNFTAAVKDETLFSSHHHLNYLGAKYITPKIVKACRAPTTKKAPI